ncbi:MAG: leucine-rich repeat domain-containing protein [Bacilli bacterium]|nr:leucine-rich repeat domain-containing protein [Bacilli bacterium]
MKKHLGLLYGLSALALVGCASMPSSDSSSPVSSPLSSSFSSDTSISSSATSVPIEELLTFSEIPEKEFECSVEAKSKDIEGEVVIPNVYNGRKVTRIEDSAFEGCTKITRISIPWCVEYIGSDAFYGATSLEAIDVASDNPIYASHEGVLMDKENSALVLCPQGKKGDYAILDSVLLIKSNAFEGCEKLNSVTIPASVRNIAEYAFDGCASLTAFYVDPENREFSSVDGVLFNQQKSTLLLCPNGKEGAYIVPSTVEKIDDGAFEGCSKLTSLSLQEGLKVLGESAFSGCELLSSLTLPKTLTHIGELAFTRTAITSLDVPSNVIQLEQSAFYLCEKLESINVHEDNVFYASRDGVVFYKSKSTLLVCPEGKSGDYAMPEGYQAIGDEAFEGCKKLTSIALPASLNYIGENAFSGTEGNLAFTVADGSGFYSALDGVLFNQSKTTLISYPQGKSGAYVIPETVTALAESCFENSVGLTSVTIPSSIAIIPEYAFFYCEALTSISFLDTLKEIHSFAFSFCSSLTSIDLPVSLTLLEDFCFSSCTSLASVRYLGTLAQWGEVDVEQYWCNRCPLTKVTCSDGEVQVGD